MVQYLFLKSWGIFQACDKILFGYRNIWVLWKFLGGNRPLPDSIIQFSEVHFWTSVLNHICTWIFVYIFAIFTVSFSVNCIIRSQFCLAVWASEATFVKWLPICNDWGPLNGFLTCSTFFATIICVASFTKDIPFIKVKSDFVQIFVALMTSETFFMPHFSVISNNFNSAFNTLWL